PRRAADAGGLSALDDRGSARPGDHGAHSRRAEPAGRADAAGDRGGGPGRGARPSRGRRALGRPGAPRAAAPQRDRPGAPRLDRARPRRGGRLRRHGLHRRASTAGDRGPHGARCGARLSLSARAADWRTAAGRGRRGRPRPRPRRGTADRGPALEHVPLRPRGPGCRGGRGRRRRPRGLCHTCRPRRARRPGRRAPIGVTPLIELIAAPPSVPPVPMRHLTPALFVLALAAAPASRAAEPPLRTVRFLVLPGVYNAELMPPSDVLDHVRFRTKDAPKVFTVAPKAGPLRTFEGLTLPPHHTFADAPAIDLLVVPSAEHNMDTDLENAA